MAETDGTPRYRKSKSPKGVNGRSTRITRPNGKARKRDELNNTLPSGAAGEELDQAETLGTEPGEAEQARVSGDAENSAPQVVKTMPTVIRAELASETPSEQASDALAQPHEDMPESGAHARLQRGPNPSMLRSKRPLLASTLRMELTVHRNEGGSEPEISVRPIPSWTASQDGIAAEVVDMQDGATTLPENTPRSRKPTAPGGFASTFQTTLRGRAASEPQRGDFEPQQVLDETVRRGSDIAADSNPNMPSPRPRRPRRPGERTLIMTRRDAKPGSKRDWIFVVLLVAALGLTASMFLSRQAPGDEVVDASAYDDAPDEQQPDPFTTTLQPYKARADKSAPVQTDQAGKQARTESSISASTIQATELRSLPSGAEVVAGNAVVGSTPVRVARGSAEMAYTLRMPGHQPKVVHVGPQSPASIMVELTRNVAAAPAAAPGGMFGRVGGIQPPEPPAGVAPSAAPSVNPAPGADSANSATAAKPQP